MNREERAPTNRRWLDWNPTDRILADLPQTEPTKPTKPGFDGSVGSPSASPTNIQPEKDPGCGHLDRPHDSNEPSNWAPNRVVSSIGRELDSGTRRERVMSWSAWKAAALNRMFLEQGSAGQSGRITAETVRHGQGSRIRKG
jgi:hypothetical protein